MGLQYKRLLVLSVTLDYQWSKISPRIITIPPMLAFSETSNNTLPDLYVLSYLEASSVSIGALSLNTLANSPRDKARLD